MGDDLPSRDVRVDGRAATAVMGAAALVLVPLLFV